MALELLSRFARDSSNPNKQEERINEAKTVLNLILYSIQSQIPLFGRAHTHMEHCVYVCVYLCTLVCVYLAVVSLVVGTVNVHAHSSRVSPCNTKSN